MILKKRRKKLKKKGKNANLPKKIFLIGWYSKIRILKTKEMDLNIGRIC